MSLQLPPLRRHHLPKLALLLVALIFVVLVFWYTAAAARTPRSASLAAPQAVLEAASTRSDADPQRN